MATEIVVNTGPLITLAKIDALSVVGRLPFQFVSPQEVFEELKAGEALGYPKIAPKWLEVQALTAPITPVALTALDLGESAVIQMALARVSELLSSKRNCSGLSIRWQLPCLTLKRDILLAEAKDLHHLILKL